MDVFFFNDTATTEIYTLSLRDALPIFRKSPRTRLRLRQRRSRPRAGMPQERTRIPLRRPTRRILSSHLARSEEHTSEFQSRQYLVCRLLLPTQRTSRRLSRRTCRRLAV